LVSIENILAVFSWMSFSCLLLSVLQFLINLHTIPHNDKVKTCLFFLQMCIYFLNTLFT
jgi:hypothetical protein